MRAPCFNRRHLLQLGAGVAGLAVCPSLAHARKELNLGGVDSAALPVVPDLTPLVHGSWLPRGEADYAAFKKVVEAASDFVWLTAGDTVMLKLSLNSHHEYPATTDPWAVDCMVRLLEEKGAGRILVADKAGAEHVIQSPDRVKGSSRKVCARAGLLATIEHSGAEAVFFEEAGWDGYFEATPDGDHHWDVPLMLPNVVQEVDHIVYLARVSSHAMGSVTSGLKIGVGFLRDDNRLRFHQGGDHFHAMYEEVNVVPAIRDRLRLVVSTGSKVLATIGPDIGQTVVPEHGLLFASEDLLAHELLAYAYLRWVQSNLASRGALNLHETVARNRNGIHRGWLPTQWPRREQRKTPDMPTFHDGPLLDHPAIGNALLRLGGRPAGFEWELVGGDPVGVTTEAIKASILAS